MIAGEQLTEGTSARPQAAAKSAGRRRRGKRPSCETCFFGCRGLCALELGRPCATFRPDGPDGLLPPRQPALLVREPEGAVLANP